MIIAVPEFGSNKPLVTGLEWEDPLHVNRISGTEHRRLSLILTQIAVLINKRKLVLRPYFQDYELVRRKMCYLFSTLKLVKSIVLFFLFSRLHIFGSFLVLYCR